jgi:glycosyltransferase involved in cell wall biosynthesis
VNNPTSQPKVLGLFPYFGPEAIGGIQSSARIAWSAVRERAGDGTTLVGYTNEFKSIKTQKRTDLLLVRSRVEAIREALSRRWDFDLIIVGHLGLLKLLPFFRISKTRTVLILLGIECWDQQSWLTARLLDKVDLFLSISNYTWQRFAESNQRHSNKAHQILYLGIGSPETGNVASPRSTPAALSISRLLKSEDYKGHRELIEAWPLVLKHNPLAELWIAGDGDLRPDLEKMVSELQIAEKIKFLGRVTEEQKQVLLHKSRCLVMPSRGEGFGLVYLEAMRLGRPCLVSTLDAGREVVNPPEAGLAVDPRDQESMASAIVRLISDSPEWDRWSEQARRRYESNFTAQHFQQRLLDVLFSNQLI